MAAKTGSTYNSKSISDIIKIPTSNLSFRPIMTDNRKWPPKPEMFISLELWQRHAGLSGLAVTCLTAVWEDQASNPTAGSRIFIVQIPTIYSLGHGLRTLTALPRSTQPSTLRGMVKWVSAFELSNNNKWRWWVWLLAAYRRTQPGSFSLVGGSAAAWRRSGWTLAVALSYADSTINIVVVVIIITTISITFLLQENNLPKSGVFCTAT